MDHIVAGLATVVIGFILVAMGFYSAGFAAGKSRGIDEANAHNDKIERADRNEELRKEIEDLGRKVLATFEERKALL